MGISVSKYKIENIPISKKKRLPKFSFDVAFAEEAHEIKSNNPDFTLNMIVGSLLEQYLSDDQSIDFESHKRRILRRIELLNT